VIEPRLLNLSDDLIVEVTQVNIADLGPDCTGHWFDLDPVEVPRCNSVNSHRSPQACCRTVAKYQVPEKWQLHSTITDWPLV